MVLNLKRLLGLAGVIGFPHGGSLSAQYYSTREGYNPYTGTSARASEAYNPYTGTRAAGATAYNPYTGRSAYHYSYQRR